MSFSSEIKNELCKKNELSSCCLHAQLYGLLLCSHFSKYNLSITTENSEVFKKYNYCISEYCHSNLKINELNKKKLTSYVDGNDEKRKVLEKFGHLLDENSLRVNHRNLMNDCCVKSFISGVFLACGSVTEPEKNYHLEFVIPYKKLCNDIVEVFEQIDLTPKIVMRKGNYIIYFKGSESIEDILAIIGAEKASLYLMNVKIEKDVKNKVNRQLNFEMSNLDKTVIAAGIQISAIEKLKSSGIFDTLPEQLKEVANLRYNNPEATLTELSSMLTTKLSKSGVMHRLKKIMILSENL